MSRMRVLFLSRWFPFPPDNGSKLRIYNLLRGLSSCHEITLLSFTDRYQDLVENNLSYPFCDEVKTVRWSPFRPQSVRALSGYLSSKPRSIIDTYSAEMADLIVQTLKQKYDLVIVSQVDMAVYADLFRGYPALFDEVEIGAFHQQYSRASLPWDRARVGLRWWKYQKFISKLMNSYRYCTVVSEPEKCLLEKAGVPPEKIYLIRNSIDMDSYRDVTGLPGQNTLIFPGSIRFYANHDAVTWFLDEIFPIIVSEIPDVRLNITGNHEGVSLPHNPGVSFTGHLEDIKLAIASSWISLAPIRLGGGTRLKILESMSLGTPVVSTSKGAEGLDVAHEKHILIADTPQQFAGEVIRLLLDPNFRQVLAENGKRLVSEQYNWAVNLDRFLNLVQATATGQTIEERDGVFV
jgi:glycosyltransferase involved in cell wall biosynthesis